MKVTLEGGDALLRKLKALDTDVGKALARATLAGAEKVAQAANPLAPAPRIAAEIQQESARRATAAVGPPDDKWYWKFLESGAGAHGIPGPLRIEFDGVLHLVGGASHPGMAARPFLRPAWDETAQGEGSPAVRVVGEVLNAVILELCE